MKLKAWWGGAEYLFIHLFEEIAVRAKIDVEDLLMSYRFDDIIKFLENGKAVSKNSIIERRKVYAFHLESGKLKFFEGESAINLFKSIINEAHMKKSMQISGIAASGGIAKGKVRVVRVEDLKQLMDDMKKFRIGEIMVTTMTQPTMAALAGKAAAIITDEGGITSHASILAREFKIPCIVGTKNATDKLKDGDLVEVDANMGIVRILAHQD